MSKKALVLSSGGVDSTTCLSLAINKFGSENVTSVSFFYGQKHDKELKCARELANYYHIKHYELDLSSIMQYSNCSLLTNSTQEIKHQSYAEQIAENGEGRVSTYVPFRNGLMLSAAAALADSIYENEECDIYIGAHADDAAGNAYADCSTEFVDAMAKAINIGTYEKINIIAPFVDSNKAGVVKKGLELKTPYELTWSCYEGKDTPCGKCGTCIDRAAAFAANNVEDPAIKLIK
ncbi:MAG: 7-cyano-7-deazaguanine synthase QueC [Lachnospiraceae bacterium]|nr:7-cyano-7-deazaguanine synthase QueC [Lachnospiraceae bacterium]